MTYKNITLVMVWLVGLLFVINFTVLATSVDRMGVCNLEGYAGKTINQEITLEGTDSEERSGFWYTHYKETEGDDNQMDISSWISFEPEEYIIKEGEIRVFTVKIEVPRDAKPGLWGAVSKEACMEGRSNERRTYIVFKDALAGGNVYSGLLIPISVNVIPNPNPLAKVLNFVIQNILVITLFAVIIAMAIIMAILLFKKRKNT